MKPHHAWRKSLRPALSERSLRWGASALATLVLVSLAAFAAYERLERQEAEQRQVELLAQSAESQLASRIQMGALLLDVLAAGMPAVGAHPENAHVMWSTAGFTVALARDPASAGARDPIERTGRFTLSRPSLTHGLQWEVHLDLQSIERGLQGLGENDGVVVALADGRVLGASPSSGLAAGQLRPDLARRISQWRSNGSLMSGRGSDGDPHIIAVRQVAGAPDLYLMYQRSQQDALALWRQDMRAVAMVGTLTLLLIAGVYAIARRTQRARDLTQDKLDEALVQLAARGTELGVLVAGVQELVFRTDAFGRFTFLNERWRAVTDRALADLIGARLAQFVTPDTRAMAETLFHPGDEGQVRKAMLAFSASGAAGLRHFQFSVTPIRAGGRLVGHVGSAIDITEQLVKDRQLREQLAYNELLIEMSPLPTSLVNAKGVLITVNAAWEQFRACRKADVVGRPIVDILTPAERVMSQTQNLAVLDSGGSLRYETRVLAGDGSQRDVVLTKVAVTDASHGPCVLTVAMDVSEFREAERATRLARDLAEQASRSKSEFVANISHELRTPLQSILGFSELGIVRSSGHPRLNEMFTGVHEAGKRMLALVNDLLDVSKIESSVGTMHIQRGDLRDWVEAVVSEVGPLLAQRKLRLNSKLGKAPLITRADPLRLQQVVRNLLANAIKFSPPESTIDLQAESANAGDIVLTVRDHGPGIPPADMDRIFEAFVQSNQSDAAIGTGLGLAISRKIVDAHEGRIWAENMDDGGSRFHSALPAARGFADTRAES